MWQLRRSPGDLDQAGNTGLPVPNAEPAKPQPEPFDKAGGQLSTLKIHIHRQLLDRINLSVLEKMPRETIASEVSAIITELLEDSSEMLNRAERLLLCEEVLDELLGLGPLEPLLKDETINDILVNGPEAVFVERFGVLEKVSTRFQDSRHLLRIIQKIVSAVGRRVDESSPFVDARLPDGSRVNAIVPPLAIDGALLSIRKFSKKPIGMDRMIDLGSMPSAMAQVLQAVVLARRNVIISGGTGSGKTTMLNALSSYIDSHERIVTIEDSAELQLQQEHHANTPRDALSRIEQMVGMSGIDIAPRSVRAQIASAINVVLQIGRLPDGKRKVLSLSEITGMEGETISMQEIFRFHRTGREDDGTVIGHFEATGIRPRFMADLAAHGIHLEPELFRPTARLEA